MNTGLSYGKSVRRWIQDWINRRGEGQPDGSDDFGCSFYAHKPLSDVRKRWNIGEIGAFLVNRSESNV